MIRVCDSLPGSGKTSAAIRYMNEHPDRKFIFITPYLEQASRIKTSCPTLRFVQPSGHIPEYKFRIRNHTAALIKEGRNIASTHEAFRSYTQEMLEDIAEAGYTLILDESFDILKECDLHDGDIELLLDTNSIRPVGNNGEEFELGGRVYKGRTYRDIFDVLKGQNLVIAPDRESKDRALLLFWAIPTRLLTSFKDVVILTYMFCGQDLCGLLTMERLGYSNIYVKKDDDGFRFTDERQPVPDYARHLRDKVHVLDDQKMNAIGKHVNALSMNWFKQSEKAHQLKNNIYNYFRNMNPGTNSEDRMWSTYCKSAYNKLKGQGYTKGFLPFNARARNDMAHKTVLVYAVNIYMNVPKRNYLVSHGYDIDQDVYALSTMIQWIWRSAIRNGEDINIYIPSRRMRTLLINWMDALAEGGDPYVGKKMCPVRTL